MRKTKVVVWLTIMVLALGMMLPGLALAQGGTATGTPTAASGPTTAATATPSAGTTGTGVSGAGTSETSMPLGPLAAPSGTVRQSFDLLGADVESLDGDEVPDSGWFTNRASARRLTASRSAPMIRAAPCPIPHRGR